MLRKRVQIELLISNNYDEQENPDQLPDLPEHDSIRDQIHTYFTPGIILGGASFAVEEVEVQVTDA